MSILNSPLQNKQELMSYASVHNTYSMNPMHHYSQTQELILIFKETNVALHKYFIYNAPLYAKTQKKE